MFNIFDEVLRSGFQAYGQVNQKRRVQQEFKELTYYPMLFSSAHLNHLLSEAKTKEEHEMILEYLYRFNATEVDSYKEIENKIIEKYREPAKLYSIKGGKRKWK